MIILLKLAVVFGLIILLLSRKIKLGYVLFIASLALGFIFQAKPVAILGSFFATLRDIETIKLVLLLSLIMVLEKMMSRKAMMSNIVASLKHVVGDYRLASMLLPALIGVLPSAGGAVFSAPMVNEVCSGVDITSEKKSFINYWYRHVWDMIFPIYMSLVIASSILKVSINTLIGNLYPYTIITILVGLPFTFFTLPKNHSEKPKQVGKNLLLFLLSFSPILLILLLYFIIKLELSLAVLAAIILLTWVKKIPLSEYAELMKKDFSFSIIFILVSVLYFKNMLTVTGVVTQIPQIFNAMGVPALLVAALLPFIIGLLGGMDSVFVAVTFPIVGALGGRLDMRLVTVAYTMGHMGVMLSPLHLCLTLTVDYFKASFNKVLLKLAVGQVIVTACAMGVYFMWR